MNNKDFTLRCEHVELDCSWNSDFIIVSLLVSNGEIRFPFDEYSH